MKMTLLSEKRFEKDHQSPQPKVRSPKWKFTETNWDSNLDGNVFYRTYLGGLSLLFPDGERFFIRAVKAHLDQIQDPQLLKDVKGFIGQEIQHGKLHEDLNSDTIGAHYEIDSFLKNWTSFAFGFLEKFADRFLPKSIPLSVTAAAEHFTATWAKNALTAPIFQRFTDLEMRDLIQWHAIEELEHKHVAFDVLRTVDDNYITRAAGMVFGAALIGGMSFWAALHLLRQEENVDWKVYFSSMIHEAFAKEGMLRLFAVGFFEYLRPGFHPDDVDDSQLLEEMSAELEKRMKAYGKKAAAQ